MMLDYFEMTADPGLNSFIRKFWIIENPYGLPVTKFALPNTCMTLAIISGNGLIINFKNDTTYLAPGSYLVGELTKKIGITVLPNSKAFMVQLNPWAGGLLSGCSYHELVDQFSPLVDINKTLASAFHKIDNLNNHITRHQIQKAIEKYGYPTTSAKFIEECFYLFDSHPLANPFKIKDLSLATGYSVRYIERKFRQHVGLTPKNAFSISKIRKVVDELSVRDNDLSLTAIAYKYGYSDQAHFTKSYYSIMDSLPSKFIVTPYLLPLKRYEHNPGS